MARTRTTKKLAQRIDLNYFKRPTPLKRAKFWLSLRLPLLVLIWISWRGFSGDHRVYSSGRMSKAHAVLEKDCATCHVKQSSAFTARAADDACLACHDGPIHHTEQIYAPNCTTCHIEHRGRISLVVTGNESCGQCHARLLTRSGNSPLWAHIRSFEDGHPEFAALRSVGDVPARDPATIKLNHAIHMKPIRRGPNGPDVQLECGNCHRSTAAEADLTFADPRYRAAAVSYKDSDVLLPGIETCKKCHAPGPQHAESRCFECHTYHDWSKRKEVTPRFTLPALRTADSDDSTDLPVKL